MKEFIYHFWCYNYDTGTSAYPESVEVDVCADSELEALQTVKEAIKDRNVYKLLWVKDKITMVITYGKPSSEEKKG
jgi:hypothetical protein